jgi:hypothetical protein
VKECFDNNAVENEVHLIMTAEEAGHVLESIVTSLHSGAWNEETQETMTALALFLRDFLDHALHVPALTGAASSTTRNAA